MKRLTAPTCLIAVMAFIALPTLAAAHAFIDHAEPKIGSTVGPSPLQVRIWLTQNIEPAFSGVKVFDAKGKQIDKQDSHRDEHEKNLLIVSLPDLAAGTYKVDWHVVSVDTHRSKGDFKFTVR